MIAHTKERVSLGWRIAVVATFDNLRNHHFSMRLASLSREEWLNRVSVLECRRIKLNSVDNSWVDRIKGNRPLKRRNQFV